MRKLYLPILGFVIFILIGTGVNALTGSIGNAKMVLRMDLGSTLIKNITVRNINDYAVTVTALVTGNPAIPLMLITDILLLEPGESGVIPFMVTAKETGNYSAEVFVIFEALEEFPVALFSNVTVIVSDSTYTLESRLSALESWKQTISVTINAIENQLESVKQWLFFWEYQEDDICSAIQNECGGGNNGSCTNECSQGTTGCVDQNTRWHCQMQYDGCYDKVGVDCAAGEACTNGACIPQTQEKEVIFRTNVMNGNYYGCTLTTNCWIAVDFDGDGNLDAMGFDGKSNSCHTGTTLVNTPEHYPVIDYESASRLAICDSNNKESRFSIVRIPKSPELSKDPKEPYKSNNQEVYEFVPSGNSGEEGNPSVNVSVGIGTGTIN